MTYTQYTDNPLTGYGESVKNRIDNNSNAANSEASQFPTKLDLFVNKENNSLGAYAVTESHILSQLVGSTLYLDHRPAVDATGGVGTIIISNGGVIDTSQTDIASASIEFSTLPSTSPFTVTYSAAADKVQDSHLNALQNAVMTIQDVIGISSPVNGEGTGIISLPIVSTLNPRSYASYTTFQSFMPSVIMLRHLSQNLIVGSSDVAGIPGYGTGVTIAIGSTGINSRDVVIIDSNDFTLRANDSNAAQYKIGTHTGEAVDMSGRVRMASQLTVGLPGGAYLNYDDTVPVGAASFYSGAAIRAHGGIWFGSGLSGNGSVTFITTTGEAVDIQGNLIATTLDVNGSANFDGPATFNNYLAVNYPGYIVTSNDILLQPKVGNVPSLIDSLDPSYAQWVINNPGNPGTLTNSVRPTINTAPSSNAFNAKLHPVYGYTMYPIIGGWTYTGVINYEKASLSGDKNILLLNANMSGIGPCATSQSTAVTLGGGIASSGDYCTGLFNPGDTYIEIKNISDVDAYSYPIYYHVPYANNGTVTGLNVYVVADDLALQSSMAGKQYRLYQPGNAPVQHLTGWAGADSFPLASYGTFSSSDYPYATINAITNPSWIGGANVLNNNVQYKHVQQAGTTTVALKDALEKSINNITGTSIAATGIAYVYIAGNNTSTTQETSMQVRASPTPYGLAGPQLQIGSPKIVPGQHIAVGEIVASTTNGTTWSQVECVSYRPNGYYDSCWVPLVEYKNTSIPNFGRCLPFYSSTTQSDSTTEGWYQFWVEHNLGPVDSFAELDFHIYIANYGTQAINLNPGVAGVGQSGNFKLSSCGSQNLWTPHANQLAGSNQFYRQPLIGSRGFVKEITPRFYLSYFDTRFAKFIWDSNSSDITVFRGESSRLAGYIRVILKKA